MTASDARLRWAMAAGAAVACVAAVSCAPTGGGGEQCTEELPTGDRCCASSMYELATVTDVVGNPAAYMGKRIEVVGTADWYQDERTGTDCVCAANACSCFVPIGLRSGVCAAELPLGGEYRYRSVQCAADGCYPFTISRHYAVCGLLGSGDPSAFGALPILFVEVYCEH